MKEDTVNIFDRKILRGLMLAMGLALVVALLVPTAALADKGPPVQGSGTAGEHNVGSVVLEIDDDGGGSGWSITMQWTDAPGSYNLFDARFAVGNSPTRMMNGGQADWTATAGGTLTFTEPGVWSDEDGYAQYDDINDPDPLGLQVTQHSCAWADSPWDDFVLVAYVIENISRRPMSGLYAGHYVDFDALPSFLDDTTGYDTGRAMAWVTDADGDPTLGLRYFIPPVSSQNNTQFSTPPIDANMYGFFSSGEFDGNDSTQLDWENWLGTGDFSLAPGETYLLGTAWVAGGTLANLQANADYALDAWLASDGCGVGLPEEEEFVPEPGSVMLLGSGLLGLAGYAGLSLRKK
jgi:hypothetical protein